MTRRRGHFFDAERLAVRQIGKARALFAETVRAASVRDCQTAGAAFTSGADALETACAVLRPEARKGLLDKACDAGKRRQLATFHKAARWCQGRGWY